MATKSHESDVPTNRHYWRATFTIGEFRSTQIMIDTADRDFAAAQSAALAEHEQFHLQWPGPVELVTIEYLGER